MMCLLKESADTPVRSSGLVSRSRIFYHVDSVVFIGTMREDRAERVVFELARTARVAVNDKSVPLWVGVASVGK